MMGLRPNRPWRFLGHRSIDLAMTTLFGGFEKPFYEAYHHHTHFPRTTAASGISVTYTPSSSISTSSDQTFVGASSLAPPRSYPSLRSGISYKYFEHNPGLLTRVYFAIPIFATMLAVTI